VTARRSSFELPLSESSGSRKNPQRRKSGVRAGSDPRPRRAAPPPASTSCPPTPRMGPWPLRWVPWPLQPAAARAHSPRQSEKFSMREAQRIPIFDSALMTHHATSRSAAPRYRGLPCSYLYSVYFCSFSPSLLIDYNLFLWYMQYANMDPRSRLRRSGRAAIASPGRRARRSHGTRTARPRAHGQHARAPRVARLVRSDDGRLP
jgi:hypothetical protein